MRLDPIFKKQQAPLEKPKQPNGDLLRKYRDLVNHIMTFRFRLMAPIGIILHLSFTLVELPIYPAQVPLFFTIRLVDSFLISILIGLSFYRAVKNHIVWCADLAVLIISAGVCLMIYLTDGASSHYYEGLNLTILALLIVNGFYFWHSLITCLIILILYSAATIPNSAGWDFSKFCFANYFMGTTAFFVVLMTKFYSLQHFNAFMSNEGLKESERKLEILYGMADEKAKIDDLTKIYNRRYFFEILANKIKACKVSGSFFYLIIFDIDHFKQINDTYGHAFGDQVIVTVAETVRRVIRINSYVGRYGGDEFLFIIDQATRDEFLSRVRVISNAIRNIQLSHDGRKVDISASFGAARFEPDQMMNETKLVELADGALLEVKRTKRGEIKLVN